MSKSNQPPRMGLQDRSRCRERARSIRFLQLTLLRVMTLEEAARALQVSDTTLDRMKKDFLADDREDTDILRTLDRAWGRKRRAPKIEEINN
jgi:hypothetical protein